MEKLLSIKILTLHPGTIGGYFIVHCVVRLCHKIEYNMSATREAHAYWSGQPSLSPGDLPDPGIELGSPALQADSLSAELPGKPIKSAAKVKRLCEVPENMCHAHQSQVVQCLLRAREECVQYPAPCNALTSYRQQNHSPANINGVPTHTLHFDTIERPFAFLTRNRQRSGVGQVPCDACT